MIRKLNIILLSLCLLAWSVITPVQAGQGKQGFKAASGKVVFQNLTTASTSSDTAVKKSPTLHLEPQQISALHDH